MDWDVTEVEIVDEYALLVKFKDGVEGVIKFLPTFFRGVFSHLCELEQFQQVTVIDGVLTWPGDLDLAPDAMHHTIKAQGEWILS